MNLPYPKRRSSTRSGSTEETTSNGQPRHSPLARLHAGQVPQHTRKDKGKATSRGIYVDSRSNGPAVMSFLLAGGNRPTRSNKQGWHIDHIYDEKFSWVTKQRSLHTVKDSRHCTQAAGLVTIHPIAEALKDGYFYFAWLLRREAFLRFNYDPDCVFSEKVDECGFRK